MSLMMNFWPSELRRIVVIPPDWRVFEHHVSLLISSYFYARCNRIEVLYSMGHTLSKELNFLSCQSTKYFSKSLSQVKMCSGKIEANFPLPSKPFLPSLLGITFDLN